MLEELLARQSFWRLSEVSSFRAAYSDAEWEILPSILRLLPIAEGKLMEALPKGAVDFRRFNGGSLALGEETTLPSSSRSI